MSMNVSVVGNLTRDPELRFTPKGDAVANFSIAVNERVKEGNDWVDGPVSYYDVTAWRYLAEAVAENLTKGQRVVVLGKMKIDKYETRDGEQRSKPLVTAEEIGAALRKPKPPTREPEQQIDDIPPF